MPFFKAFDLEMRFARAACVRQNKEELACKIQINSLQREIREKRMRLHVLRKQKRAPVDEIHDQLETFRERLSAAPQHILEALYQEATSTDFDILSALHAPISNNPCASSLSHSNRGDIVPDSEPQRKPEGNQSSVLELERYNGNLRLPTRGDGNLPADNLPADASGSGKDGNTV